MGVIIFQEGGFRKGRESSPKKEEEIVQADLRMLSGMRRYLELYGSPDIIWKNCSALLYFLTVKFSI